MKSCYCKLIGEAAAGVALGRAFRLLLDALKRTVYFNSYLDGLQSTLSKLKVIVESHEGLDHLPGEEINGRVKLMEKGEKLVEECSGLKWWKQIGRCYYAYKLQKLDKELLVFFQTDIVAGNTRDLLRVLQLVEEIQARVVTNTDSEFSGGDAHARLHE